MMNTVLGDSWWQSPDLSSTPTARTLGEAMASAISPLNVRGGSKSTPTILEAMHVPELFGPWFEDRDSWQAWEAFLCALFGLPMNDDALGIYQRHTGRTEPPTAPFNADQYLANAKQTLKRSTWIDYEGNVRLYLKPAFGDRALDKIARADIKHLALALRCKGKKPKTARKVIGTLSAILSEAMDDNLVATNPALGLRKIYRSPDFADGGLGKDVNPLTRNELAHLLATARDHVVKRGDEIEYPFRPSYPFLLLLARTGLRLGESLALKWGDIDWRGGFIEVQRAFVRNRITTPKNKTPRRVDMSAQLQETLRAIYAQRFEKVIGLNIGREAPLASQRAAALDTWVFPGDSGNVMDADLFRRTKFAALLVAAKLRHIRIHDLRHTYASLLIEAGKELHYIQQQLGHHSPAFTLAVYGHLLPRDRRGEVNCLDDVGASVAAEPQSAALEERRAS